MVSRAFRLSVILAAVAAAPILARPAYMPLSSSTTGRIGSIFAIGLPRFVMISSSPRVLTSSSNSRQRALNSATPNVWFCAGRDVLATSESRT